MLLLKLSQILSLNFQALMFKSPPVDCIFFTLDSKFSRNPIKDDVPPLPP